MRKKKLLSIICCVCLVFTFCFGCIQNIVFAQNNVICQFNRGILDNGSVNYSISGRMISLELATRANNIFTKVDITNLSQSIDLNSAEYYLKFTEKDNADLLNGGSAITNIPGDGYIMLETSMFNNGVGIFELSAKQPNGQQEGGPGGPVTPETTYHITAYFEGVSTGVTMDEQGTIVMPDGWTTGKVTFKAKGCTVNGVLAPDNGYTIPDEGSKYEIAARVEGIANGNQLNGTVEGSNDRTYVEFKDGFDDCGKATIHITSVEENVPIDTIINIVSKDAIYLTATAPLSMSMGIGSQEVTQAMVTKNKEKDLSIFFGNIETNLKASGATVEKITAVTGGKSVVLNNEDGSATINLPKLSEETTTKVNVTILLKDGTSIVRTVNIKRTAILLEHDDRENELKIGYVMNKDYLYNNQSHSDSIFDAYIQVILYKGNTVAGFKQIKVPDEEIVNALVNGTSYHGTNLPANGSWSIETYSDEVMKIDLSSMEGITKASVFLTNGPIDFDSDTLPSVEFGIGSGLTIEFGGEE